MRGGNIKLKEVLVHMDAALPFSKMVITFNKQRDTWGESCLNPKHGNTRTWPMPSHRNCWKCNLGKKLCDSILVTIQTPPAISNWPIRDIIIIHFRLIRVITENNFINECHHQRWGRRNYKNRRFVNGQQHTQIWRRWYP